MLALLALPVLLGLGLILFTDDESADPPTEEPTPDPLQVPDDAVSFRGTDGDDDIIARDAGGFIAALRGDDTVTGSDNVDDIAGRQGDDTINARGGDDRVWGDGGNDLIRLGAGEDRGIGSSGNDSIYGGEGNDHISGESEDDLLYGGAGNDTVTGGHGNDLIHMGAGDDSSAAYGDRSAGDDTVHGGAGDDLILEGRGANLLFGGSGNDEIRSLDGNEPGVDTLYGGDGNDTLHVDDGDVVTGGSGLDIFAVHNQLPVGQAPVIITDFDTDDDLLALTEAELDILTLRYDTDYGAVVAATPEAVLAILEGLTEADIPNIFLAEMAV